jgi:hypothetical protein
VEVVAKVEDEVKKFHWMVKVLKPDLPNGGKQMGRIMNVFQVTAVIKLFTAVKAGLHYGDYHSRLVHFEAQKIFSTLKKALA